MAKLVIFKVAFIEFYKILRKQQIIIKTMIYLLKLMYFLLICQIITNDSY